MSERGAREIAEEIASNVPMACLERHYGLSPTAKYTHDDCVKGVDTTALADLIAAALATAEAERDKARELLRAEADQKWKEYDRANALSAEAGRLRAALRTARFTLYALGSLYPDVTRSQARLEALAVADAALRPPSQPPSGAGA